jgi:hypothetical protein
MIMKHTALILFFLIWMCSSCAQVLVPVWFDPDSQPFKSSHLEFDGVTLVTENLESNDQHLVFDVEIRNEGDQPIQIDPGKMYFLGSDIPFPPETLDQSGTRFESGLKKNQSLSEEEVGRQFKQKIKASRRTGILLGLLSAGLVIYDAAKDTKDLNSPEWTRKKARNAALRDAVTMASLTAMEVVQQQSAMTEEKKGADLYYLPEEILRSQVLAPGEFCRGKVFFPGTRARFIKLILPIDYTEYAFDYRWAETMELRKLRRNP